MKLAVLVITAASLHGDATYSGIIKPYMYADNLYFKQVSGTGWSNSTCTRTKANTQRYLRLSPELDADIEVRNFYMSYILAAYMAGREVSITATGVCSNEGDEETR
ncbi:MAG: hypothetical protein COB58_09910 [Thalassobium sp.]|nr:MAG: hypothetical protein COB43_11810 [Oceanospirillales bacterium]PHQ85071.1 MAG: hypothetical protein COB58_09910 [Thalassobium sp.]